jgi:hypothetical protein
MAPTIVRNKFCGPGIARIMAPACFGKVIKCDDQLHWITLNIIYGMVTQFTVKSVKLSLGKNVLVSQGYTH